MGKGINEPDNICKADIFRDILQERVKACCGLEKSSMNVGKYRS